MMESVDPQAPIQIVSKEGTDEHLKVLWRVTFRKGFEMKGHTVQPGSTYEFDATLKKTEDGWLIDNF